MPEILPFEIHFFVTGWREQGVGALFLSFLIALVRILFIVNDKILGLVLGNIIG